MKILLAGLSAFTLGLAGCNNGHYDTPFDSKEGFPATQGYVQEEAVWRGKDLKSKYLNRQLLEQFEKGHTPGADPIMTDIRDWTGEEILAELKENGGMYYPGRIRTERWGWLDGPHEHTTVEKIYWDREYNKLIHGWGGFNFGAGYGYANVYQTIEGTEPLIKGPNYNPPRKDVYYRIR